MWETKPDKKKEESMPKEHTIGDDYKEIIPDFVTKDFEKQKSSLGSDKLKDLHKIDLPVKDEESTLPKFIKEELGEFSKKEMLGLDKELKMKEKVPETGKLGEELLGQTDSEKKKQDEVELLKMVGKESADLEKTVEELLPFLGDKTEKEQDDSVAPKHVLLTSKVERINENPINAKTKEEVQGEEDKSNSDEKEEEMMSTKNRFRESAKTEEKDAMKKVTEEQKVFEEAEKLWESEIQKNAMEEIRKIEAKKHKTAGEMEVDEQSDEVIATTEPEKKKEEQFKPIIYFNFDEIKDEFGSEKEDLPKEEKVFPLPTRVQEPASLFKQKKQSESAFDEMSPEIQPLFQRLDDALSRKKILREEKQWMKLKKWAAANLLKPKKSKDSK